MANKYWDEPTDSFGTPSNPPKPTSKTQNDWLLEIAREHDQGDFAVRLPLPTAKALISRGLVEWSTANDEFLTVKLTLAGRQAVAKLRGSNDKSGNRN